MNILQDFIEQIKAWPASVAMVVALAFAGIALKRMHAFPNRYIPAMLMAQGTILYALVGEPGSIHPGIRHPVVVLGLYGCILGMVAWLAHGIIWKFIESKVPGVKNEDTDILEKPKDEDKK